MLEYSYRLAVVMLALSLSSTGAHAQFPGSLDCGTAVHETCDAATTSSVCSRAGSSLYCAPSRLSSARGASLSATETSGTVTVTGKAGGSVFCCEASSIADLVLIGTDHDDEVQVDTETVDVFVVAGQGDDAVTGPATRATGTHSYYGEDGADVLRAGLVSDGGPSTTTLYGGEGADTLYGGAFSADALYGGGGADRLFAGDGADRLFGEGGDDWLWGGPGQNYMYGGSGDDVLIGAGGADHYYGGPGADALCETDGQAYIMWGDAGADHFYFPGASTSPTHDATSSDGDRCNDSTIFSGGDATHIVPHGCAAAGLGTAGFFYQRVDPDRDLVNHVHGGLTIDGMNVTDSETDPVASWDPTTSQRQCTGDPNFSRLSSGEWRFIGRLRGNAASAGKLLVEEDALCPPTTDFESDTYGGVTGDEKFQTKQSVVVEDGTDEYVFFINDNTLYGARIADASNATSDLTAISFEANSPSTTTDIAWGSAEELTVSGLPSALWTSDLTVVRRVDEWVMYLKGLDITGYCDCLGQALDLEETSSADGYSVLCADGGKDYNIADSDNSSHAAVCELCNRHIYRATSDDLVDWTAKSAPVVQTASVPEALSDASGRVWLYWQDSSELCEAFETGASTSDQALDAASFIPMGVAWENDDYSLHPGGAVVFVDRDFETCRANASGTVCEHYPTNPNPVLLPSSSAVATYRQCLGM